MTHRRTMGGSILNESLTSAGVSSPLRRRSLAAPRQSIAPRELIQNDDESERLARRRQEATLNNSKNGDNTERRVSLGLVAGLSAAEITEHYNKCLKLSAENKINSKNVFALSMIDYMAVLNKRDQTSNNMQTAGTTLDVSTKIYSLRVDCVYGEAFKMAGDPGVQDKQKENEPEADDDPNTSNAKEPKEKKKKKHRAQKILSLPESVEAAVEEVFLCAKKNDDDWQTNDMLLQIRLPIHTIDGCGLHAYEDVIFDRLVEEEDGVDEVNSELEFIDLENFKELGFCPSLDLDFLSWSIDDVPDLPWQEQNGADDDPGEHRFDINASLIDTCDDNVGMNYFDLDEGSQENIDRCGRIGRREEPENIVDFCGTVTEKEGEEVQEYSYVRGIASNLHWAGPTHWKPRIVSRTQSSSRVIGACRQEGARKKREVTLDLNREALRNFFDKLQAKIPRKLNSKTLRQTWQEEKLTLPEDVHYDSENPTKFYIQSAMRKFLYSEKRPSVDTEEGIAGEENSAIDDIAADYNYDNLNDTLDYCSQNKNEEEIVEGELESGNLFQDLDDGDKENENPFGDDLLTQGLTGGNLIAAPKATAQTQIQYATKAKKIDMRQLKRSLWKVLTNDNNADNEKETGGKQPNGILQIIEEPKDFNNVYKQLPNLLGKENADALSPALALASLLHLANEKCLSIKLTDDLSDFKISRD